MVGDPDLQAMEFSDYRNNIARSVINSTPNVSRVVDSDYNIIEYTRLSSITDSHFTVTASDTEIIVLEEEPGHVGRLYSITIHAFRRLYEYWIDLISIETLPHFELDQPTAVGMIDQYGAVFLGFTIDQGHSIINYFADHDDCVEDNLFFQI